MHVLQVIPYLTKGGAERVVVDLSNALHKEGHSVSMLLAFPVDTRLNQSNVETDIDVSFVSQKKCNVLAMYFQLIVWILRNQKNLKSYDVIHCHLTYGIFFGVVASSILRKNVKLVATCHSVAANIDPFRKIFYRKASRFFCSFVLVGLDSGWEKFISRKVNSNVILIPNGIAADQDLRPTKKSVNNEISVVATLSRLELERSPKKFLEVFSEVHKLLPGVCRFILAGDGSQRSSLANLAKDLGIHDRLSMPGLILDPGSFFEEIDVYLTLNMNELTGIAGLEAIMAGKLVFGIQLSSTYERGENDFIWSNYDPVKVANEVVKFLQNPTESTKVRSTQLANVQALYSVERMLKDYMQLYLSKG